MKNAEYYINLIFYGGIEELIAWKDLQAEVLEWFENASSDERELFCDSGAGEALQMLCG